MTVVFAKSSLLGQNTFNANVVTQMICYLLTL